MQRQWDQTLRIKYSWSLCDSKLCVASVTSSWPSQHGNTSKMLCHVANIGVRWYNTRQLPNISTSMVDNALSRQVDWGQSHFGDHTLMAQHTPIMCTFCFLLIYWHSSRIPASLNVCVKASLCGSNWNGQTSTDTETNIVWISFQSILITCHTELLNMYICTAQQIMVSGLSASYDSKTSKRVPREASSGHEGVVWIAGADICYSSICEETCNFHHILIFLKNITTQQIWQLDSSKCTSWWNWLWGMRRSVVGKVSAVIISYPDSNVMKSIEVTWTWWRVHAAAIGPMA